MMTTMMMMMTLGVPTQHLHKQGFPLSQPEEATQGQHHHHHYDHHEYYHVQQYDQYRYHNQCDHHNLHRYHLGYDHQEYDLNHNLGQANCENLA